MTLTYANKKEITEYECIQFQSYVKMAQNWHYYINCGGRYGVHTILIAVISQRNIFYIQSVYGKEVVGAVRVPYGSHHSHALPWPGLVGVQLESGR
jgi:hypothetical protein